MHCKELALESCRRWQSEETGFVHFCYRSPSKDTIPVRENLYFVLALLRSRIADHIQEAKSLLEKLLCYQKEGNFPVYLHEYPFCYDRWQAAEVLPSLIWMTRGFSHVLGSALNENLKSSIRKAVEQSIGMMQEHKGSYLTSLRIGCSVKSAGKYFHHLPWIDMGGEIVRQVEVLGMQPSWLISEDLGHMLASLNLDAVWPRLWEHCQQMHHKELAVFCGPHLSEKREMAASEPTLFELYMEEGKPIRKPHPMWIQGALFHAFEKPEWESVKPQVDGVLAGQKWEVFKGKNYACSLMEYQEGMLFHIDKKGFSPVHLIWGGVELGHSLVAQGGNVESVQWRRVGNMVELLMSLGEEAENDHPKERMEMAFFCTRSNAKICIDQKRATLFRLGQKVDIESAVCVRLEFFLEEGEGDFTGHLSFGNRLSQVGRGEEADGGEALDWKIALRSVRRSRRCVIRVKLTIDG